MAISRTNESKPHIYAFWGDDRFSIGERLTFWKNEFRKKYGGHTLWAIDASSIDDGVAFERQVAAAFRTATLFPQPRLTILKDCDEFSPATTEMISSLLATLPASHFVVMTFKKWEKKKPLFAALEVLQKKGKAVAQEYRTPTGAALTSWVQKRFLAKGKEIDTQVLRYFLSCVVTDLSDKVGTPDSGMIASEIDKLCSYAALAPISQKNIDAIVSGIEVKSIFELEDAILQQEQKRALRTAHILTTQRKERGKNAILGIIGFLAKDIRGLLLIQSGMQPSSWSPQRLWHAQRKIGSIGADQLRYLYKNLLLCEQKLKSSSFNAEMVFDSLVVRSTQSDRKASNATPWRKAR
ncbi:hypothetical protein HY622_00065 [Candidatus Uhrbacteria bacterium]|nr:hypothetical protein [Candidatus Uhrbacteria bacterium]